MSGEDDRRLAPGPGGPEMLANFALMRRRPPEFLAQCAERHGPVVRFPIPRSEVYLLSDPTDIRRVLQTNHKAYGKRTIQYDTLALVTGTGLLASDADLWLRMRRLMAPAFHRDLVSGMADSVSRVTNEWVERVSAGGDVALDLDAAMLDLSLEIVAETLFGGPLAQRADRVVTAVMDALHVVVAKAQQPVPIPDSWPTPGHRRLRRALTVLDAAVDDVISARREAPAGADALSLLIQAQDAGLATPREVRDEVVTLIVAGHETVAATLTWTWVLLAAHPEVEQRLLTDVDTGGLALARAVIDECLRLYPPAWVVTRRSLEPDVVSGFEIPAGATVIISPYAIHRDARWWPEPQRFDPNRFLGRSDEQGSGPLTYLPFGAGPRLCIGRDLALLEAPIVVATIARSLRVKPLHPASIKPDFGVTLRPKGGLPASLTRR